MKATPLPTIAARVAISCGSGPNADADESPPDSDTNDDPMRDISPER